MDNPFQNRARINETAARISELPQPDADAEAHSQRLIDHIRLVMDDNGGRISFTRYMSLALMAPGLGYYSAGSRKFGEQGDFVTAPEISSLFSHCLARQCHQVFEQLGAGGRDILEFGAGTGTMAAGILLELKRLACLPDHYFILEPSADLQARQRDTLQAQVPRLLERVEWLSVLPDSGFRGVILANEVLDAMPVQRIRIENGALQEYFVTFADGRFQWQLDDVSDPQITHYVERMLPALPDGYSTEINLAMQAWLASLAPLLDAGLVLLVDYGFPAREYYHPQRANGTLMCHYRHRSHDDPFVYPGLQDITAHVDFTAVAEAAVEAGFDVSGYCAQAWFLLSCGLGDMLSAMDPDDVVIYAEVARQVRVLTSPEEMGELFKVIALTKKLDQPLTGFSLRDQREKL